MWPSSIVRPPLKSRTIHLEQPRSNFPPAGSLPLQPFLVQNHQAISIDRHILSNKHEGLSFRPDHSGARLSRVFPQITHSSRNRRSCFNSCHPCHPSMVNAIALAGLFLLGRHESYQGSFAHVSAGLYANAKLIILYCRSSTTSKRASHFPRLVLKAARDLAHMIRSWRTRLQPLG